MESLDSFWNICPQYDISAWNDGRASDHSPEIVKGDFVFSHCDYYPEQVSVVFINFVNTIH